MLFIYYYYHIKKWLKPGGQLLISDYCCGEGDHSDRFKAYVKQRNYHLLTVPSYGKVKIFKISEFSI
jgi:hypothetical protein